MKIKKSLASTLLIMMATIFLKPNPLPGKNIQLLSPNGKIAIVIIIGDRVYYSVFFQGKKILTPSSISMTLDNNIILGEKPRLRQAKERKVSDKIFPSVKEKRAVILDEYNELILKFRGNYGLIFRAYNDGVAYRFFTDFKKDIKVFSEEANFLFS